MELVAALRRQWILTCALLVLTLVGAAGALVKLPWTYQSTGNVVFLVSKNSAKTFGGNPYLGFNAALNQTADVVRYEVMDVNTANHLASQGYSSSYLITDAIDTAGPVLLVTVTGHDKTGVEHTLYGVLNEISVKLSSVQLGLAPDNKIRDLVLSTTPQAKKLVSKKARPLLEVVGLGFIFTVAIPLVVDAVRTRRSGRKSARRRTAFGSQPGEARDRSDNADELPIPASARPYGTADRRRAARRSEDYSERRRPEGRARTARRS
jgi:hypothetical protein